MRECDHCGQCCLSGVPCTFGQILFGIEENGTFCPIVCPACVNEDGLYWCGLLKNPLKWFKPLVGAISWKCEAMADIARIYIGIGNGCGMNPTQKEITQKMKEALCKRAV